MMVFYHIVLTEWSIDRFSVGPIILSRVVNDTRSWNLSVTTHDLRGSYQLAAAVIHWLKIRSWSSVAHSRRRHRRGSGKKRQNRGKSITCPGTTLPLRPDSLLRLWRYINHLLTYLQFQLFFYTHKWWKFLLSEASVFTKNGFAAGAHSPGPRLVFI